MCRRILCISELLLSMLFIGCQWFHSNNKDDNDNPQEPTPAPWTRVESIGDEPILGLYVNSDSTELHLITPTQYGYLSMAQADTNFALQTLSDPLAFSDYYIHSDDLPYFTDQYCFYCNESCETMNVYRIGAGQWEKKGELYIHDFLPDTTSFKETFGLSLWMNIPNHIVSAGNGLYYITVEEHFVHKGMERVKCRQHLVQMSMEPSMSYQEIYRTNFLTMNVDDVDIYSTHYVAPHFLISINLNGYVHLALTNSSSTYIAGTGRYPVRDVFPRENYLVGLGDGVIQRSFDGGVNWEDWLHINGPWSYAKIAGRDILFYISNFGVWDRDDPTKITMLDTATFQYERNYTNYIVEFNGYVYAGTTHGLWVRPVSDFFTPRDTKAKRRSFQIESCSITH